MRLAYVAVEEYLRSYWYFVVAVPIAGIVGVFVGDRFMQAISFMALLWPISIPARAILTTSKASRLFATGVSMRSNGDEIEFLGDRPGPSGKPLRLAFPIASVRDVVHRQGYLLIRTYRLSFAPVDTTAFASDADREAFIESLQPYEEEPDA